MSGILQKITGTSSHNSQPSLTKEELEILLKLIANSDFKGREIEPVYNLVVKLQNMYLAYKS